MAETIPGGRYRLADGTLVNANGVPIEEETAPAAPAKSSTPDDTWTVKDLKAHAEQHSIDLGPAKTKAEILAAIQAAPPAAPAE